MASVAFLMSGQGEQKPGMGAALIESGAPEVAETFFAASEIFGFDVADVCLHASAEILRDTAYAQPAMCALSVAVAKSLMARGVCPSYVAGFSLGQIAALAVCGMTSEADAFRIAAFRAKAMAKAAAARPGSMCALLGGDMNEARDVCLRQAGNDVLVRANYNAPGQTVVSGDAAAVERAAAVWCEKSRHKSSMLATSGAFHSPLMQPAADELSEFLEGIEFREPSIPLVCNTDARPLSAGDARAHLAAQVSSPVLFEQSVRWLSMQGVDAFVECGFGGVLSKLVRRIEPGALRVAPVSPDEIAQVATDFSNKE